MPVKPKLIVILGPTSSGKTSLAVKLAKKFRGEIISADSRQVYCGMDIGTGKDLKEYGRVKHHLIDIIEPQKQFNVADYQKLAYEKIREIHNRGKIPFLVGGTGLYISAVVEGYQLPTGAFDKRLRTKLEKLSLKQLLTRFKKRDPLGYRKIQKKNKRRVLRALEICFLTKKSFSEQQKRKKPPFDILQLGIKLPRQKIYQKIDQRLKERFQEGLIAEVKRLHKNGVSWKRLEDFGLEYRWIARYLQKKISREEMVEELKKAIHQFSKRQMTWFKRDKKIHWISNQKQAEKLLSRFCQPLHLSHQRTIDK